MNNLKNWHPLYQEIAQLIGATATLKLQAEFGGTQLTFPKRLLDKNAEAALIYQESQAGQTVAALARQHDYSEKSIRRILAKYKA